MKIVIASDGYFGLSKYLLYELFKLDQSLFGKCTSKGGIDPKYKTKEWNLDYKPFKDGIVINSNYNIVFEEDHQYILLQRFEDKFRINSTLVFAIEKLGIKKSSYTKYHTLKIVEIPDDVKEWYILEDEMGGESVHEVHRSWS